MPEPEVKGNFAEKELGIRFTLGTYRDIETTESRFIYRYKWNTKFSFIPGSLTDEMLEEWRKLLHEELDKFHAFVVKDITEGINW